MCDVRVVLSVTVIAVLFVVFLATPTLANAFGHDLKSDKKQDLRQAQGGLPLSRDRAAAGSLREAAP